METLVLWVLVVTNAINLIDGLDGLGAIGTGSHAPDERVNLNALKMQTERTAIFLERIGKLPSSTFSRTPASDHH